MLRISAGPNPSHLTRHWHAYIASQASVWPRNTSSGSERASKRVARWGWEWETEELHALFKTIQTIHTPLFSMNVWPLDNVALPSISCSFNTTILWNAWNCLLFKPLSGVRVNTVNETDLWMPCIVLFIHSFRSVNSNSHVFVCICVCTFNRMNSSRSSSSSSGSGGSSSSNGNNQLDWGYSRVRKYISV